MPGGEHLLTILIQAMLGLAIFSFLEYSIRTVHAPEVVNRRAKLICAAGLTLSVLGMWVLFYHRLAGIIMTLTGAMVAVLAMFWLETTARKSKRARSSTRPRKDTPPAAAATSEAPPTSSTESEGTVG